MKNDVPLNALVPASSVYSQTVPTDNLWPFIKTGAPLTTPIRAACIDGANVVFAVHAFAKPRIENGNIVETAEDHASRIGAAIEGALDKAQVIDVGAGFNIRLTDMTLMQDPDEVDSYHYYCNVNCRVLA